MTPVLPMTVAQVLEQELFEVHGVEPLNHQWEFTASHVRDQLVLDRLEQSVGWTDAYTWIESKLELERQPTGLVVTGPPLWQQLTELSKTLFHRKALKSRMISSLTRQMAAQVRQRGSLATSEEILRVNRTILEELFPDAITRIDPEHLAATLDRFHQQQPSALCLSGGGIRSATFGLGVLQGLARTGNAATGAFPIEGIDYLSTVSGGGYIGGWLSTWILRSPGANGAGVFDELRRSAPRAIGPEAGAIRWLREYSNYLSPRLSLFSVDTGTIIATWVRNVFINWLIFLPFLALLMLAPRLMASLVGTHATPHAWLLATGIALTVLSVACIASARPIVQNQNRPVRLRKIKIAQLSIFGSALLLSLFWAGLPYDNISLFAFVLFGVGVQTVGTLWHVVRHKSSLRHTARILPMAAISGVAGGVTLKLMTLWEWMRPPIRWPELYALAAPALFLLAVLIAATTFTALTSRMTRDAVHEYWNRIGASLIIGAIAYLFIGTISFYLPVLLAQSPKLVAAVGGITGLVGILLGSSGISPAGDKADRGRTVSDRIPILIVILLAAISWAMTAILASRWRGEFPAASRAAGIPAQTQVAAQVDGEVLELPSSARDHLMIVRTTAPREILTLMLWAAMLAFAASLFADVNKFSMHALYRMRLVRAYLGASNRERNPDPFTGFDKDDSVLLCELRRQKPFLIVNMALNLVRGSHLAWQQRKASTFTASPLHCGNWKLGYRRTRQYSKPPTGLDLGTAMTISGAAASPNMGYHSSPPLSFLLAMFNVRLGAWLGNPGVAGGRLGLIDRLFSLPPPWQRSSPKSSIAHQLAEAFGSTDDTHRYVYLSDGGHFENLGLYEMVLRRCRYVIVSDAGADPDLQFEDLGNAVRKIRIDFGVPVDFRRFALVSRDEKQQGAHCAIGKIRYSAVDGTLPKDDGHLLYIKASYYASGPQDVRQYARKYKRFPHEPTADQFFTESQFESYRRLGEWVIDEIMAGRKPATLGELFDAARRYERKHKEVPRW
jgi:hypothetical protein